MNKLKTRLAVVSLSITLAFTGSTALSETPGSLESRVVLTSEVKFDKLNPARGDRSPKAGTLWGDRNGQEATGFLFNPVDGFESPPHIHNITYRGVVIRGVVHNDDPHADRMWMPACSFWTQPKGQAHITSARGIDTLAYIEIDEGPYLVQPTEDAFQTAEVPINIDASNLVWSDFGDLSSEAKRAYLWGTPEKLSGSLLKVPRGTSLVVSSRNGDFRAIVIQGQPDYRRPDTGETLTLEPGSLFMANAAAKHRITADGQSDLILYIRSYGDFELHSNLSRGVIHDQPK